MAPAASPPVSKTTLLPSTETWFAGALAEIPLAPQKTLPPLLKVTETLDGVVPATGDCGVEPITTFIRPRAVPPVVATSVLPCPITIAPVVVLLLAILMFPSVADRLEPGATVSGAEASPAAVTEMEPLLAVRLPTVRAPDAAEMVIADAVAVTVPPIALTLAVAVPAPALKLTAPGAETDPPLSVTLPAVAGLKRMLAPAAVAASCPLLPKDILSDPSPALLCNEMLPPLAVMLPATLTVPLVMASDPADTEPFTFSELVDIETALPDTVPSTLAEPPANDTELPDAVMPGATEIALAGPLASESEPPFALTLSVSERLPPLVSEMLPTGAVTAPTTSSPVLTLALTELPLAVSVPIIEFGLNETAPVPPFRLTPLPAESAPPLSVIAPAAVGLNSTLAPDALAVSVPPAPTVTLNDPSAALLCSVRFPLLAVRLPLTASVPAVTATDPPDSEPFTLSESAETESALPETAPSTLTDPPARDTELPDAVTPDETDSALVDPLASESEPPFALTLPVSDRLPLPAASDTPPADDVTVPATRSPVLTLTLTEVPPAASVPLREFGLNETAPAPPFSLTAAPASIAPPVSVIAPAAVVLKSTLAPDALALSAPPAPRATLNEPVPALLWREMLPAFAVTIPLRASVPDVTLTEFPDTAAPASRLSEPVGEVERETLPPAAVTLELMDRLPPPADRETSPFEEEMAPAARFPEPEEMVTELPLATTSPVRVPPPVTLTGLEGSEKVSVPWLPVPELADIVPASDTASGAAASFETVIVPPLPEPGASAVRLPVMPLDVMLEPTMKGLVASLYKTPIEPPLPVPSPLALSVPLICKVPVPAVPAAKLKLAPFPPVPVGPAVIALVATVRFCPADNDTEPPFPPVVPL